LFFPKETSCKADYQKNTNIRVNFHHWIKGNMMELVDPLVKSTLVHGVALFCLYTLDKASTLKRKSKKKKKQ